MNRRLVKYLQRAILFASVLILTVRVSLTRQDVLVCNFHVLCFEFGATRTGIRMSVSGGDRGVPLGIQRRTEVFSESKTTIWESNFVTFRRTGGLEIEISAIAFAFLAASTYFSLPLLTCQQKKNRRLP